MAHLARTLVLLGVLGSALCMVFKNNHKRRASQWLRTWTDMNDEVAFATCGRKWKPFDALLIKHSLIKATVWSRAERNVLYEMVLRNIYDNKNTAVVFPTLTEGQNPCLLNGVGRRELFLSVDWIIFKDDDESVAKMQTHLHYLGRCPACVVPQFSTGRKFEGNNILQKGAPVVFSRRCVSHDRERVSTWKDAFNGATISVLCYADDSPRLKEKLSFNRCYNNPIAKALRSMNATLIFKQPKGTGDMNEKLYRGEVDIDLQFVRTIRYISDVHVSFPYIAYYRYERFYAYLGDGEQWNSSFTFFGHSQLLLALLVLTGAAVWLALSAIGCLTFATNFSCRVQWGVVLDSAMFTISTLLSTSVSTVFDWATFRPRSFGRGIRIVLAVWLLGMIPLSFFRAVLTARLTIYVSPNPVDTLEELEAHLDSGMIQPCVVKNHGMHVGFLRNTLPRGGIYEKLRTAYFKYPNVTEITFDKFGQCMKRCAAKPGFVCLYFSYYGVRSRAEKNTVESREHLGLGLVALTVRKNFPEMRAYRNLVQRMSETTLFPKLNDAIIQGAVQSANEGRVNVTKVSGKEALKVSELRSFWICFLALQLFSVIVCCLEVAIGRVCLQSISV